MKTVIEMDTFIITVEDVSGKVEIKAEVNDEVVEELTLDSADYEGGSEEDEDKELKAFGDEEASEEGEEASEEIPEGDEEEDEMMEESIKTFDAMFPSEEDKK